MSTIDYKSAGVDIAAGNEAVQRIKKGVESTFSSAVLTDLGSFGSLYDLAAIMRDYQHPVLVQSIDGVGTKIMIARMMQKFDTIGMDLVSATTNDIVVLGAKPLTLLDYIANDKLNPAIVEQIVMGMVKACRENHISLVGGETAEMPGTYLAGEHDLVGVITGVVDKNRVILGKTISPGDVVLAFTSSGLHTNGYSLARKLFFEMGKLKVDSHLSEYNRTLGEVLLEPHINYTRPVLQLLQQNIEIKGMAHITGGGLLENIPRILPSGCAVEIQKNSWPEQPVFSMLEKLGHLPDEEMYRTFNMGVGLVMILAADQVEQARQVLEDLPQFKLYTIGQVVAGAQQVRLI
jgi:phosphoribosylformylglycinamidine cyclo-ligase